MFDLILPSHSQRFGIHSYVSQGQNTNQSCRNLPSIIISFFVFTIGYLYALGRELSTREVAACSFFFCLRLCCLPLPLTLRRSRRTGRAGRSTRTGSRTSTTSRPRRRRRSSRSRSAACAAGAPARPERTGRVSQFPVRGFEHGSRACVSPLQALAAPDGRCARIFRQ